MNRHSLPWSMVLCALLSIVAAGPARAGWPEDGTAVAVAPCDQESPEVIADGAGGVFVVWGDARNGVDYDIYAQHLDADGEAIWPAGGVVVCTAGGAQARPQAVADGAGGLFVVWHDHRQGEWNWDVYAQRLDADGVLQWGVSGLAIAANEVDQGTPVLVPDGAGGAVIAWRDGCQDDDIVAAQRIDADGNLLWGAGRALCIDSVALTNVGIAPDGEHGAIVAWTDARGGDDRDVYAQRITGEGDVAWAVSGMPICTQDGFQQAPRAVADGAGGAIVVWQDARDAGHLDIYAQRLAPNGEALWATAGEPICGASGQQSLPQLVATADGAVIAWVDHRGADEDIYAQRVDLDGQALWAEDGVAVCSAAGDQDAPRLVADGSDGAVVVWEDGRGGPALDVHAQRLLADGSPCWPVDGVAVCGLFQWQDQGVVARTTDGAFVFVWRDWRSEVDYDVYAARFAEDGTQVPVLLRWWTAACRDGGVVLEWDVARGAEVTVFSILRHESGRSWSPVSVAAVRRGRGFACVDRNVRPGATYRYRVFASGADEDIPLFETDDVTIPQVRSALGRNHPNPFNPRTVIPFFVSATTDVTIRIHDAAGRRVRDLVGGRRDAGRHAVVWDGCDACGRPVAAGAYYCRLEAGAVWDVRAMTVVR